jgi:hypothetical protein
MLSIGELSPAPAGAVDREGVGVAEVGPADATAGEEKPAAAARGENADVATRKVATNPAAAST